MKKNKKFRLVFPFSRPSFLTGFGSVLNIAGHSSRFRASLRDPDADAKALASDWEAIGNDFRKVMGSFDENLKRG